MVVSLERVNPFHRASGAYLPKYSVPRREVATPFKQVICKHNSKDSHKDRLYSPNLILKLTRVHHLSSVLSKGFGVVATVLLSLSFDANALNSYPSFSQLSVATYNEAVKKRESQGSIRSNTLTAEDEERLREYDREMFTDDGWAGLEKILEYARYVNGLESAEQEAGCEECGTNRMMLEKAWQVVSNEFYDPTGKYSEAAWAGRLLDTLKDNGGLLHNKKETYAAIRQMLDSLDDKYTTFMSPTEFRKALRRPQPAERDYLAAQFIGVGIAVGDKASLGGWTVEAALAESPAEDSGIIRGDRLLEIDGMSTDKMSAKDISSLMRGPAGSLVDVMVVDAAGLQQPRSMTLERRRLPQPPIKLARLDVGDGRQVAYVRMHYFSSDATRALVRGISAGEAEGVAGYILDLRNNPGGVFEEAISSAGFFLNEHAVVTKTVRTNNEVIDSVYTTDTFKDQWPSSLPRSVSDKPLIILVNRSSASASEVLSAALHDNHRAILIGERTFGKGVVQYYFPLRDGSGVKITVAKYLSPHGFDISREGGLVPDTWCSDVPHTDVVKNTDECIRQAVNIVAGTPSKF